jgi:acetamidase/formamidase
VDTNSFHDVRPEAFQYVWDNSVEPALEIESGEVVRIHVRDASDEQIHKGSGVEDVAKLDFSHVNPVSGPVLVKGARPGDVLQVELLEFGPSEWGWTAIIPGFGLLADEFPEPWLRISEVDAASGTVRFGDGITLPHRPFPGTLGVAMPQPGEHSIVPPSRFGGNMDTKHLRAGTVLFLPVGVAGALFSLGDTHAAQGDGEVCGTAIETAMEVTLRLSLRRDFAVEAPQYVVQAGAFATRRLRGSTSARGSGPTSWRPPATPSARRSVTCRTTAASSGKRPTRSRAWPRTCASTRSSTRPTGSSVRSSRIPSSKKEADPERRRRRSRLPHQTRRRRWAQA